MTVASIARWRAAHAACPVDMTGWLGLAASPTFALMAWVSAGDASQALICPPGPGRLPIGDMAAMYLLMCLFHLAPWLTLASGRRRRPTHTQTEGD